MIWLILLDVRVSIWIQFLANDMILFFVNELCMYTTFSLPIYLLDT